MKLLVVAGLAALAAPTALAFDVNVPAESLLQRIGTLTVMDLAVGEIGIVAYPSFCTESGHLYASGILPLAEKENSMFSVNYRFKRMPNSVFEVTAEVSKDSEKPVEHWIANAALGALMTPCSKVSGIPYRVEIMSVNGKADLASLLP